MYNKIREHLTTGCRALIAAVLLIAGIIWQAAAGKLLDQTAFYLMAAAMLCFATVIFTKCKPDMIQYVIGNMIVLIIGFLLGESDTIDGTVLYTLWIVCLLADWGLNIYLLKLESIGKRIGLGALAMIVNVLLIAVVYLVPILVF